jgi:hypothetical protein
MDGPTMVPIDQTKGMTAYAFAASCQYVCKCVCLVVRTLVLRIRDHLSNHSLNDAHVSVQGPTECSSDECHPEVSAETNRQQGNDSA